MLGGAPLDPSAAYNLTVNNSLADGGDNFAMVTVSRLDGGNDLIALINYLGAFSPVDPASTDRVNELPYVRVNSLEYEERRRRTSVVFILNATGWSYDHPVFVCATSKQILNRNGLPEGKSILP